MQVDAVAAQIAQAQSEYRRGNIPAAQQLIEVLASSHPDRADVQLGRGMILMATGEVDRARFAFLKAVELDSQLAEAHYWATLMTLNQREFSEAELLARKYIEAIPNQYRAYYLLAATLRGQGRQDEALRHVDQALVLAPEDVDALVLKARILKENRMAGLAVEFYRKAMTIRPNPAAAVDLARLLIRESRPESAIEVLKSAEPAMPNVPTHHALFAEAHSMLGQTEEASERWQRARKLSQNPNSVELQRAKVEIAVGKFADAQDALLQLIEQGYEVAAAFQAWTTTHKVNPDDAPLIEKMEALAAQQELEELQSLEIQYGLGKAYDDLKQYGKAIRHFDEANRIGKELFAPRREFQKSVITDLTNFFIETFTKESLGAYADRGETSDLPVFVLGMMRSGTTLTETILSAHSQVRGIGEQAFWTERAIEFLFREGEENRYDHDSVLRFASDYLAYVDPNDPDIRYVVDKNPSNYELAGALHAALPNARVVHLQRNPVDNLLSLWMTPMSGNVAYASSRENLVHAYREHLRLLDHWKQVLPEDRFKVISYEALTSEPHETISDLLEFLDLIPEAACFSPETSQRAVLTPSVYQVRQPIHRGSQERWRNYEPWLGEFAEMLN